MQRPPRVGDKVGGWVGVMGDCRRLLHGTEVHGQKGHSEQLSEKQTQLSESDG